MSTYELSIYINLYEMSGMVFDETLVTVITFREPVT